MLVVRTNKQLRDGHTARECGHANPDLGLVGIQNVAAMRGRGHEEGERLLDTSCFSDVLGAHALSINPGFLFHLNGPSVYRGIVTKIVVADHGLRPFLGQLHEDSIFMIGRQVMLHPGLVD